MRVLVMLWVLVALHGALLLWGGIQGRGPEGWGLHAWGYLPLPMLTGLVVVAAAAALAVMKRWPFPACSSYLLQALAVFAVLFFLFRDQTHLLGDGRLWISNLRQSPVFHSNEPLAFALPWLVTRGAADTPGAFALRLELWSVLLGLIAVLLSALIARRVTTDRGGRWFALLLMVGLGSVQFGFGYIEAYPTLWVAVLFFVWAVLRTLETKRGWPGVGLALGLAMAVHSMGVLLVIPGLLLLRLKPGIKNLGIAVGTAAGLAVLAYGALPYLMPSAAREAAGLQDVVAGSSRLLGGMRIYPHGLPEWILDQVNRWSLLAPLCVGLVLIAWAGGRLREEAEAETDRRERFRNGFLGLTALVLMLPALVLDTEGSRGASVDWDAFAVAGVPLAVWVAFLWGPRLGTSRLLRLPLGAAVFLTTITGYGFVLVNASETRAPERLEALATSTIWTSNAKGLAYESLATHYRDRGDSTRAAEMYGKAIEFQGGNVRLLRNTAVMFSRLGRDRDAIGVYQKLLARESSLARDWVNYAAALERAGAPDSAAMAYRFALRLDDSDVNSMNQLARLLLIPPTNEAKVRQAYGHLRRSLELQPNQPYAEGIRRTLARIEAQGIRPR